MSLFSQELLHHAAIMLQQCRARNLTLATAESCTGGLLSALITEIPGSSSVFTHGYVTYANAAKQEMLGVDEALIKAHGEVSKEVAVAMAEGARSKTNAGVSVSITGIAGPGGATATKHVGLVHLASARSSFSTLHSMQQFSGDRATVRMQAVVVALELLQRQMCR